MQTIVCPSCRKDIGEISKPSNSQRVIVLDMDFIGNDMFECPHCSSRFEIKLAFREEIISDSVSKVEII
jgi:hypothetical protein